MNQDILLSKIVANASDTTWSQAYTTLNVFISLSIHKENPSTSITSTGKDILEKLQREFFALDEKNLENIKKAVSNVVKTIEEGTDYSILVGTIVNSVLYIIIASQGQVVMKRKDRVGVIAKGEKNGLIGFSGRIEHDDVIIFETGDFAEKIPTSTLQEYLSSPDVIEVSENITPLIHEESKGTEAAIIVQYKNESAISKHTAPSYIPEKKEEPQEVEKKEEASPNHDDQTDQRTYENADENEATLEDVIGHDEEYKNSTPLLNKVMSLLKFIPAVRIPKKRAAIGIAVIALVVLLVGSIFFETNRRTQKARAAEFQKVYEPALKKYEEGTSLQSLNKTLALEELTDSQNLIKDSLSTFPKNSKEYKELSNLLSRVEGEIENIGGGSSVKNLKELLSTGKEFSSIDSATFKGSELIVASKSGKKVAILKADGSVKKSYETDEVEPELVAADEKFIYALGEGVAIIDKGNSKTTTVAKEATGAAIEVFGSNFYILNGNDVEKYRAPSYTSASYFTDKPSFSSTPTGMAINGPVYIIEENGTISKFVKGKKETFEVKGLLAPFAAGSTIYTDIDFKNIYVLDVKNQRVVSLSEKGEFQNQLESEIFKNAKSFAIDEKNKKGFAVSSDKLYSFDL